MLSGACISLGGFSDLMEATEVKRDGAKAQKNSGRGQISKGDATWHNFLVDYKESAKSFTLNMKVWAKICSDAFSVGGNKWPVLKIILGDSRRVRLGIVEWSLLEELINVYEGCKCQQHIN